jgi:deoxyhypusine synthase
MPRKVEDLTVGDAPSLDLLARRMEAAGGFSAKGVADGVDLLTAMLRDPSMTTFLSFPADIVATGTRGVLTELVRAGHVEAIITTCGTLDHDLARSFKPYYHGDWALDDAKLYRQGLYPLRTGRRTGDAAAARAALGSRDPQAIDAGALLGDRRVPRPGPR